MTLLDGLLRLIAGLGFAWAIANFVTETEGLVMGRLSLQDDDELDWDDSEVMDD